jgi:hypothetical protein
MSKTEIELRQAATWLMRIHAEEDMSGVMYSKKALLNAKLRLLHAIEASQDAEQREQDHGGFAA